MGDPASKFHDSPKRQRGDGVAEKLSPRLRLGLLNEREWRKGGDSNSYVRRRQFSGLVGYQVAHPFRMERRERVERSNAGFAIQPLTVCCCGAGDQQFGGPGET